MNGCDQGSSLDFIEPFPVTTVAKVNIFPVLVVKPDTRILSVSNLQTYVHYIRN